MNIKFKNEMHYGNDKVEILSMEDYKGKTFVILNLRGLHPCAYVESNINYYENNNGDEPAHGGFTFYNTLLHWLNKFPEYEDILSKKYVGWDYGHYDDYSPNINIYGIQRTIDEILDDIEEVIDWLDVKENDK